MSLQNWVAAWHRCYPTPLWLRGNMASLSTYSITIGFRWFHRANKPWQEIYNWCERVVVPIIDYLDSRNIRFVCWIEVHAWMVPGLTVKDVMDTCSWHLHVMAVHREVLFRSKAFLDAVWMLIPPQRRRERLEWRVMMENKEWVETSEDDVDEWIDMEWIFNDSLVTRLPVSLHVHETQIQFLFELVAAQAKRIDALNATVERLEKTLNWKQRKRRKKKK
jgi:hypothetical protein